VRERARIKKEDVSMWQEAQRQQVLEPPKLFEERASCHCPAVCLSGICIPPIFHPRRRQYFAARGVGGRRCSVGNGIVARRTSRLPYLPPYLSLLSAYIFFRYYLVSVVFCIPCTRVPVLRIHFPAAHLCMQLRLSHVRYISTLGQRRGSVDVEAVV
jgi:hypothetical protein